MVHSMLSWSPSERPEAAEIIGTPLFQELELEMPCRLAMRQRSRTYSASSMGRPSRQTSSTWKSCDAIYSSPTRNFHLPPPHTGLPPTSAPRHQTLPQAGSLYERRVRQTSGICVCGFRAVRQSPAQLLFLANPHAVTYLHTITFPILITLNKWKNILKATAAL